MRAILISGWIFAALTLQAQWLDLGSGTVLTTAPAATGLTGALVNCSSGLKPYCSGSTATYQFLGLVKSVVQAQSGAATDTTNNRMILTGGGHNDYWGNQIYVMDPVAGTTTRVSDPSPNQNNSGQVNPDGTSPSSHTQQGLVYLPTENAVLKWALGVGASPQAQTVTWWIDMNTTPPSWVQKGSLPTGAGISGGNLVLDPTSGSNEYVYFIGYLENTIYRYQPSIDHWTTMPNPGSIIVINGGTCAFNGTGVLYCAGAKELGGGGPSSGVYTYNVAAGTFTNITGTLTGCTGLYSQSNPGFVWDSDSSKFVGYVGTGNDVTVFDPVALSCSTVTNSGGPSDPLADTYGIYGLFQYYPSLHKFAVVTNATSHAFTLAIDNVAPTISTTSLPNGNVNSGYSQTIVTTGVPAPTCSVTSGSLPPGLSLSSGCVLNGIPTAMTFGLFTVTATNGTSPDATQAFTLTITSPGTNGLGGSSFFCVDRDGDGSGTGPIKLGPFTDLVSDGSNALKVTSASHSFVAGDVGRVITITSGTSFTLAWYLISSVSAGAAILTQPGGFPASVGGTSLTGGHWVIYGCTGPDADDLDYAVQTGAQALTKWGTMQAFLTHLGYAPIRIWLLDASGSPTASSCTPATFSACVAAPRSAVPTGITAGDMLMLRANENIRITLAGINGTMSNPIIVMGYPGETPAFQNVGGGEGLFTSGSSWITVDGLQSAANGGISGGDSSNTITTHDFTNNIFRHIYFGPAGVQAFGPVAGGTNITIQDNVFAHSNYASGEAGLYVGCTFVTTYCTGWVVQRNIAYNNSRDGIHWNGLGDGLIFTQNISHSNNIAGFSFQSGMINSTITDNLSFNNASYPMLLYNYKDGDTSCPAPASAPCGTGPQTGNVWRNNTFFSLTNQAYLGGLYNAGSVCYGVANQSGIAGGTMAGPIYDMGHNTFSDNICVNDGNLSSAFSYMPINFVDNFMFPGNSTGYLATSTFDHNVTKQMNGVSGGTYVFGVGIVMAPQMGEQPYDCSTVQSLLTTGTVTNCIVSNPLVVAAQQSYFWDPSLYDFHLQPSSPALNAGASGSPTYDLYGNPFSGSPSIGAIEGTSSSSLVGGTATRGGNRKQ